MGQKSNKNFEKTIGQGIGQKVGEQIQAKSEGHISVPVPFSNCVLHHHRSSFQKSLKVPKGQTDTFYGCYEV